MAVLHPAADGALSIALHEAATGKILTALTDDESVRNFARLYASQQEQLLREEEARAQANREFWCQKAAREAQDQAFQQHWRDKWNKEAAAYNGFKATDNLMMCGGAGGVAQNNSLTTWAKSCSGTLYNEFTSKATALPTTYGPCRVCWGKGKIRKQ